jgi:predicted Zn-dependent protease
MSKRSTPILALAAAFALAASLVQAADALVTPVPLPDLSHLPAARAGEVREARAQFDRIKTTLVGEPLAEAYAVIGAEYAGNGLYETAGVALHDAALLAPKDGRWVYAQGILARAQKQNAVAQNYFDLAFTLNHDYLPIRVAVAQSKLDNGDLDGARRLLEEYVAQYKDQAVPYAMLGEIALRQKRAAEAVEQTQRALAIDSKATRLYATLADAQTAAGNAAAAAAARAKAGAVAPALADPLGAGLLGNTPTVAAAAPAGPADPAARHVDDVASLLLMHQYDAARKELDAALKLHPDDSTLLALYARIEAAAGNLSAAKSRAASAVTADPNNALAHLSQGVAYEMANDDAAARRAYEQAVRIDPKLGEARRMLGSLLLRTGSHSEAIAQYRALVQLDLRNPEAWMQLVAADAAAGRCADALRDVSDVLAKDAGNTFVLQLFVRLASTCPAANPNERRGALEYGAKLYAQDPSAPVSEAYALALAANGRWDDAVKIQQAGMFVRVRNGLKGALTGYREVLQQLKAHKLPNLPWPASAAVYHPVRLTPDAAAAPTPRK